AAAEDPGRLARLAADRSNAAARAVHGRRSALDRSLDPGVPRPPHPPGTNRPSAHPADVPSRVSRALGLPGPPHPADAEPPPPTAGDTDDRASDGRESPAGGGGRTDRDQDRWGAAVCRRADQDGA